MTTPHSPQQDSPPSGGRGKSKKHDNSDDSTHEPAHEESTAPPSFNGSFLEPAYVRPEPAPEFVPYCGRSMALQKFWPFYKQRWMLREYFSEFFGTWLLISFGNGVCATKTFMTQSSTITHLPNGTTAFTFEDYSAYQSNVTYLCVNLGWGLGLAMVLYVTNKISGGHVNPAVTLCQCLFGNVPWIKAPGYILCQFLGAMFGAASVYCVFKPHFDRRREILKLQRAAGETTMTDTDALGGIFCTYPVSDYYGNVYCFFSELINTAIMMFVICGCGDEEMIPIKKNAAGRHVTAMRLRVREPTRSRAAGQTEEEALEDVLIHCRNSGGNWFMTSKPLAVGLLIFTLGQTIGWNSGYALNPARDLGPRMVSAMIFKSAQPFRKRHHYFWIPMFVPILGAIVGQFLYSLFVLPEEVHKPRPEMEEYEERRVLMTATALDGTVGNASVLM